MTRTRGISAVVATLALGLTVAACGSDSSSTSNSAAPATSSGSGGGAGVTKAADQLKAFQAAPTAINSTEPLEGAPPAGKTLVMLGTNDPNNQKLQKSLKNLAAMAKWNYSV